MKLKRILALTVAIIAALLAVLAATATTASGQTGDTTIDVTVRWPDGTLAPAGICTHFVDESAIDQFDNGPSTISNAFASAPGPRTSVVVEEGRRVTVLVGGECFGGDSNIAPLSYFNGVPVDGFTPGGLYLDSVFEVQPGSNELEVTIGQALLSGRITGADPDAACGPIVVGTSDIATFEGPVTYSLPFVERGPEWQLAVQPGEYVVSIQCTDLSEQNTSFGAALRFWNDAATVTDAQTVSVANGDVRAGLDVDLASSFDPSTGTLFNIVYPDQDDVEVPKCIESYQSDGTLIFNVPGTVFNQIVVADNGEHRLRVTDCFDFGFAEQWHPEGASRTAGPTITVNGGLTEIDVFASPLQRTQCNGLPITVDLGAGDRPTSGPDVILGTEGDDVINAGNGADTICGLGGNDIINAGQGRDVVLAGDGDDFVSGGKGKDTLAGGEGNDDLRGNEGTDTIDGGAGNDELRGGQKADVIFGGSGDDNLVGGTRPDVLDGGRGLDSYNGGGGTDVCGADPLGLVEVRLRCELS